MFILYKILIICFFLLLIYIVIPSLIKILLRRNFLLSINNRGIYLTFDDGPDPESTPYILSILDKYKITATFFVTGQNLEKYPEIMNQIISKKHSLGIHGYKHLHAWKVDPLSIIIDFYKFYRACKNNFISWEAIRLYRPPYGKLNIVNLLFSVVFQKKIIFWDVDPQDYMTFSSQSIADYVLDKLGAGKIILLHDGRSRVETTPLIVTINALEPIIIGAQYRDFKFCLFV